MTLSLSSRHEWVRKSELRAMSVECERVGGVNLSQGVCDLAVPAPVAAAAKAAIDKGENSYSRHDGTGPLRNALADKYRRRAGLDVDPEKNVVVSSGATGALYCSCLALLEPGDEVILFEPYYSYHESTLIATEAVPVFVPTQAPDWSFSMDDLENAVTDRTRAIIVNTPSNPSGKVWTRAELELIADFSKRHDLFVFTDEIYEHFIFDDMEHISAASLPGMWERTITISGLSKTFSITGWRIGYAICDAKWAKAIGNFSDLVYVCAPTPLQAGAAAGIVELDDEYFDKLAAKYRTQTRGAVCRIVRCRPDAMRSARCLLRSCRCIVIARRRQQRASDVPAGENRRGQRTWKIVFQKRRGRDNVALLFRQRRRCHRRCLPATARSENRPCPGRLKRYCIFFTTPCAPGAGAIARYPTSWPLRCRSRCDS